MQGKPAGGRPRLFSIQQRQAVALQPPGARNFRNRAGHGAGGGTGPWAARRCNFSAFPREGRFRLQVGQGGIPGSVRSGRAPGDAKGRRGREGGNGDVHACGVYPGPMRRSLGDTNRGCRQFRGPDFRGGAIIWLGWGPGRFAKGHQKAFSPKTFFTPRDGAQNPSFLFPARRDVGVLFTSPGPGPVGGRGPLSQGLVSKRQVGDSRGGKVKPTAVRRACGTPRPGPPIFHGQQGGNYLARFF